MEKYIPITRDSASPTDSSIPIQTSSGRRFLNLRNLALLSLVGFGAYTTFISSGPGPGDWNLSAKEVEELVEDAKCPAQPKALAGVHWSVPDNYTDLIASRLSRAVRIPSISYDDMGPVDKDERWAVHKRFADFLVSEYPVVFNTLKHEAVNTHGHLFTWQGKDASLSPVLLMAHEDVVPVNPATLYQWTHPPFEGKIEDGWVWGRGAADCKNQLMGIMNAVEKLIQDGFEPERTILIQFGFDEEIGGFKGAAEIAKVIEERYGQDSLAFLIDEGFGGVDKAYGATFASLGMAEKGSVNLQIQVETSGGHSSVPPEHTSIGIISRVLIEMENNPFEFALKGNPFLKYLNCLADFAPDLSKKVRKSIRNPKQWPALAKALTESNPLSRAFLGTTQAIDLIQGGVKVNALPELVTATANYRIAFTSSVEETKGHVNKVVRRVAKELGIAYEAFGMQVEESVKDGRKIKLFVPSVGHGTEGLEPAPITPTDTEAYELIGGTIRNIWQDAIVAPSAMFANTDTRVYWNLTKHLYRFAPTSIADFRNPHTVDEAMSIRGHESTTRFFYEIIENTNGWKAK